MNIAQKKELISFSINILLINCVGCIIILFVFSSEDLSLSKHYSIDDLTSIHHNTDSTSQAVLIPLKAAYNNQTFSFDASCSNIPANIANSWFYIGIDVLNAKKEYEYSTELSFWDASGYEGGYGWHENYIKENFKFVRENKGDFYIKLTSVDYDVTPYSLMLNINSRGGSTILFWIILFASIAAIIGLINYKDTIPKLKSRLYYD